jgi:biopolymer transport protein ExbD
MKISDSGSHDVELNLAPIIDCLTVLITFMLISASFLSIGILEASVAGPNPNSKPPEVAAELKLTAKGAQLIASGKISFKHVVTAESLMGELADLKAKGVDQVTFTPSDEVPFETLVQWTDKIRAVIPAVAYGGIGQ